MEGAEDRAAPPSPAHAFNPWRKGWHVIGCALIVFLFHLLKGVREPVAGPDLLMGVAWVETVAAFLMEAARFRSPKEEEAIERLPFVRWVLRGEERAHVNASTWLMLATALLATGYRFGLLGSAAVTGALAVTALADPAASLARHMVRGRFPRGMRKVGLAAFLVCAMAVLAATGAAMGKPFAPWTLAAAALAGAWAESDLLRLAAWAIARLRRMPAPHPAVTGWLRRVYPDDNLYIPVVVGAVLGLIGGW
ncbi:MAG: hypothetical protein GXY15_14170 [Candidatus Hydrogenedentes bacterium]|nr:hypothetical protein [Candidatus Hydrogenedentota bacterium]